MRSKPGFKTIVDGRFNAAQVTTRWHEDCFNPTAAQSEAADLALAKLKGRGSPTHDGLAARLVDVTETDGKLEFDLQPMRWSLRLIDDTSHALSVLCVVRTTDGRWLAGRRAAWVATWAGKWTLGAGGAVEVGENPIDTMHRELNEEWSLNAETIELRCVLTLPTNSAMIVGVTTVAADSVAIADAEHDQQDWLVPEISQWPNQIDLRVRTIAQLINHQETKP